MFLLGQILCRPLLINKLRSPGAPKYMQKQFYANCTKGLLYTPEQTIFNMA